MIFSGSFDASLLTNIPPDEGGSSFLPKGIAGIFPALPFAIWFYLAIEELPLAAEESHDPKRDIPRATIWGLTTLVLFAVLTLFLNTGVGGGAATIGTSATPLFDGFKAVFGEGTAASLLALVGLIGLIASFFTIIYAYGRNTYSLSRAGYFPQVPVDDAPDPKDAARRADRRRGRRVRPRAGRSTSSDRARTRSRARSSARCCTWPCSVPSSRTSCSAWRSSCCAATCRTSHGRTAARWACGAPRWRGAIALVALISLFLNEAYRPGVVGTLVYFAGRHPLLRDRRTAQAGAVAGRGVRDVPRAARRELARRGVRHGLGHRDHGPKRPAPELAATTESTSCLWSWESTSARRASRPCSSTRPVTSWRPVRPHSP